MSAPAHPADAADTAILDAFEANLWLPFEAAAEASWLTLGDEPDHRWVLTGIPMGAYNAVSRTRFDGDAVDRRIDAILERFARARVPMSWWIVDTSRPVDLAARLEARGLTLSGPLPVMGLTLDGWHAPAWPDGLEVSRIATADGFREACEVVSEGYPVPWEAFREVAERYGPLVAEDGALRCYVARDGERAIASAVAMLDGAVVGLWNVATLPDARRRGGATAVTIAALDEARAEGCRLAVLASTPAALSLYRRFGFREAGALVIAGRGPIAGDA